MLIRVIVLNVNVNLDETVFVIESVQTDKLQGIEIQFSHCLHTSTGYEYLKMNERSKLYFLIERFQFE